VQLAVICTLTPICGVNVQRTRSRPTAAADPAPLNACRTRAPRAPAATRA
jgi:hypothetical protein